MTSPHLLSPRHDHGAESAANGMSVGTISLLWFPQLYWIVVGVVIVVFTRVNIVNQLILRQRLHAYANAKPSPARPEWLYTRINATLSAVIREASNASLPSFRFGRFHLVQPTFGRFLLVVANLILVIVFCFYALSSDFFDFERTAYRCGFVSLGQLPLVFLLAGKRNVIGWLTGSSYERLNWLHRWVSRTLLVTVTIHMAYWFKDWAPYDYIGNQLTTNPIAQRGFAAWVVLVWIVLSSFAPIRGWSYEVFVLQHIISMTAFITLVFLHTPASDHGWLWAPVAIYLSDRLVRAIYAIYINLAIFHPAQPKAGNTSKLWACQAELTSLPQNVTRVTIRNPPMSWHPGQHVFLSLHSIMPLQSHPFTISSLPSDRKIEFLVQAKRGGTRRLLDYAEKGFGLPSAQDAPKATINVALEGPYGRMRPLRQFDSVVLFAGSSGATFTMPLLRDIVRHWGLEKSESVRFWQVPDGAVTRRVQFIWVVKSRNQVSWFAKELFDVCAAVEALKQQGRDVSVDIRIFVTCDESFTSGTTEKTNTAGNRNAQPELVSDPPLEDGTNEQQAVGAKEVQHETVQVREIDSRAESLSIQDASKARCTGSNGTCCCRLPALSQSEDVTCTCSGSRPIRPTSSSQSSTSSPSSIANVKGPHLSTASVASSHRHATASSLHRSIQVRTGRPVPSDLILPVLEAASGESAVVSCGPSGLNEAVRRATVALSDERAVHKGTGAQGIWYWGEGFGY